jgi:hypothetical protein
MRRNAHAGLRVKNPKYQTPNKFQKISAKVQTCVGFASLEQRKLLGI